MILDNRLANVSGRWLTTEEETLLENAVLSIPTRDLDNLSFWGKVEGAEADYLIVMGQEKLGEEEDYPNVVFYYCTNSQFKLQKLPYCELHSEVSRSTKLTGNPSTELVAAVEGEEGDEDEAKQTEGSPAFTEEKLLSVIVHEIHYNTGVVPRGAYIADPTHKVARNPSFGGLSVADASDVNCYFHFRKPADVTKVRSSEGLIKPTEFLDAISTTHPTGTWSCQLDECERTVVLRSLIYPGYSFYHAPGTSAFGGVYIGDGSKNHDIAFML